MVCLGDSFTEGMCDDVRADGHFLGWADRVAAGLADADAQALPAPIDYVNLAVRGKLLHQVIAEQVPVALAMKPDLVTFHAGPNDVLRPGTSLPKLMAHYEAAVVRLRGTGATVVLFTSLARAGGSGRLADRLEARFAAFNDSVRQIAERRGCVLVDDEAVHALTDRRFWAVDRLHLNAEGHRRVAANVLASLGVTDPAVLGGEVGWWEVPLPAPVSPSRREALAADAQWMRAYLLPWLGRRLRGVSSGDGRAAKDPQPRRIRGAADLLAAPTSE
jgi:lysophospholipase L1-like esterase